MTIWSGMKSSNLALQNNQTFELSYLVKKLHWMCQLNHIFQSSIKSSKIGMHVCKLKLEVVDLA